MQGLEMSRWNRGREKDKGAFGSERKHDPHPKGK
jgi:hypothetical protein